MNHYLFNTQALEFQNSARGMLDEVIESEIGENVFAERALKGGKSLTKTVQESGKAGTVIDREPLSGPRASAVS